LGSALDGLLRVFDKEGRSLGETDDGRAAPGRRTGGGGGRAQGPVSTDPTFDLTMPEGQSEVKLVVKDLVDRGGVGFTYRVVVTPVETGFQLALDDDNVAIPRGGTALIPVTVTRTGYNGPIALDILGVQEGVTVLPGTVPAGQTSGVVGLKAAATSTFEAREVQVIGKGKEGQTVAASRTIVFAQQTISTPGFGMAGTIPSYTRPLVSLTSAVIKPGPILLNPEASKLVVPQGSVVEVPIEVVRTTNAEQKYKLAALSPPTGLSVAELEIGATGTHATVKVTAAADAPVGPLMVGLVAQAPSQGGAPATRRGTGAANTRGAAPPPPPAVAAAMIAVEVVRPASLELAATEINLTPGGSAELRGKVTRVAPFAQEVEVKLDGLPVTIKAAPVKVAADASEFTLTLEAAGDAVPVAALANAVLAFKLGDKNAAGAPVPVTVKVLARR
jgi:hypothetical protein